MGCRKAGLTSNVELGAIWKYPRVASVLARGERTARVQHMNSINANSFSDTCHADSYILGYNWLREDNVSNFGPEITCVGRTALRYSRLDLADIRNAIERAPDCNLCWTALPVNCHALHCLRCSQLHI